MLAIGKHLGLQRQERAARIDEVDARQAVLQRDFLRPQMLLYGHRVVGAAFDGGVVGDDHALHGLTTRPMPVTMPAAGASSSYISHAASAESSRNGDARIEQLFDPLAHRQLALLAVPLQVLRSAALSDAGQPLAIFGDERGQTILIFLEVGTRWLNLRFEPVHHHPQQSVLKRHAGQRHTACMRYISAPQRSHVILSSAGSAAGRLIAETTGVTRGGRTGGSGMPQHSIE